MTTEEAFKKLTDTERWFELVAVTPLQATTIKRDFKRASLGLDSLYNYLYKIGATCFITIISPSNCIYNNYNDAFRDMLSTPDILSILHITRQQYSKLYCKFKQDQKTIRISTIHKHLETAGYKISVDWNLPNLQPISLQTQPIKSIFESNIEHAALTNTKKIFSELTETPEWYKKNPYLYRQKAQHIKNKFHNNQLTLDKMTDILVNSGYIYRLKIFSPDRGTRFLDYTNAYELMSKIYNVCDVLEIQSLSPYTIKDGDTRRLSIDIMLQFLIKIGCDVSIQWEPVEIVNV